MTDLITAEEAQKLLDDATYGPWRITSPDHPEQGVFAGFRIAKMTGGEIKRDRANAAMMKAAPDLARTVIALHAELALARADTEAAVALALEEADLAVQAVSDNCETDGERLAIMAAVSAIRALAPEDAIAEVAKLRQEVAELRAMCNKNGREGDQT